MALHHRHPTEAAISLPQPQQPLPQQPQQSRQPQHFDQAQAIRDGSHHTRESAGRDCHRSNNTEARQIVRVTDHPENVLQSLTALKQRQDRDRQSQFGPMPDDVPAHLNLLTYAVRNARPVEVADRPEQASAMPFGGTAERLTAAA